MRQFKSKILSVILALTMVCSVLGNAFSVFAADGATVTVDTSNLQALENTGESGNNQVYDVPVTITNNPGFAVIEVTVTLPAELEYVDFESGSICTILRSGTSMKFAYMYAGMDELKSNPATGDGVLFTLKLKAAASAATTSAVSIGVSTKAVDYDNAVVSVTNVNGSVGITNLNDVNDIQVTAGTVYVDDKGAYVNQSSDLVVKTINGKNEQTVTTNYKFEVQDGKLYVIWTDKETVKHEVDSSFITTKAATAIMLSTASVTDKKVNTELADVINGITLKVDYNDGSSEDSVSVTADMVSGYSKTSTAAQTLTVTYAGKTAELSVTLQEKTLDSITVKTQPTATQYVGSTLDKTGMVVTATYDNGDAADVTDYTTDYDSNTFSSTSATTVTVSYGGKTATFSVTPQTDTITAISVTANPTKTEYWYGETLDLSGLTVTADYESGRKGVTLATGSYTTSPENGTALNALGSNPVTINAGGKEATVSVTVKDYVSSISASGTTSYTVGGHDGSTSAAFDKSTLSVATTYAGGTASGTTTDVTVDPEILTKGTSSVTVTYTNEKKETLTDTVNVMVSEATVSTVTIDTTSAKKDYYVGDTLDVSGITIKVKYNNCPNNCEGHDVTVEANMVSGFNSESATDSQDLTVTYNGTTEKYTVKIKDDTVTGISLTTDVLNVIVGAEKLDTSLITVTTVMESGKNGTDVTESCTWEGTDDVKLDTVGDYTIKVKYSTFEKEVTVKVAEADKLTGIAVTPETLTFTVGDTLSISSIVVNEVYQSGAKKTLAADAYTLDTSAVKMDTAGEYTIKVTHKADPTLTATVKVTVETKYIPVDSWYTYYRPSTNNTSTTTKPSTTTSTTPTTGWSGDKYYENGKAVTGWKKISGSWYYFDRTGEMNTGWVKDGNTWYYLKGTGVMATGWQKVDGTWYYLKSSGAMATGWQKVDGTWYYLKGSGAMATGWVQTGGKWYFLKDSGAMATGWVQWKGNWYYLNENGDMAVDTKTPDGYYVNKDGIWVK